MHSTGGESTLETLAPGKQGGRIRLVPLENQAKKPARVPQKIKLQKATRFKARFPFKQQNVTGQVRNELHHPATGTADSVQRVQPKPRHRQPEPLASLQASREIKLSVLLYGTGQQPDLP